MGAKFVRVGKGATLFLPKLPFLVGMATKPIGQVTLSVMSFQFPEKDQERLSSVVVGVLCQLSNLMRNMRQILQFPQLQS